MKTFDTITQDLANVSGGHGHHRRWERWDHGYGYGYAYGPPRGYFYGPPPRAFFYGPPPRRWGW